MRVIQFSMNLHYESSQKRGGEMFSPPLFVETVEFFHSYKDPPLRLFIPIPKRQDNIHPSTVK